MRFCVILSKLLRFFVDKLNFRYFFSGRVGYFLGSIWVLFEADSISLDTIEITAFMLKTGI